MMGSRPTAVRHNGFALPEALLALLSLMAGAHSYALRTETWLTIHAQDRARARAVAEAGVWLAVADLLSPPSVQRLPQDGRIRLRAQGRLLDLLRPGDAED